MSRIEEISPVNNLKFIHSICCFQLFLAIYFFIFLLILLACFRKLLFPFSNSIFLDYFYINYWFSEVIIHLNLNFLLLGRESFLILVRANINFYYNFYGVPEYLIDPFTFYCRFLIFLELFG